MRLLKGVGDNRRLWLRLRRRSGGASRVCCYWWCRLCYWSSSCRMLRHGLSCTSSLSVLWLGSVRRPALTFIVRVRVPVIGLFLRSSTTSSSFPSSFDAHAFHVAAKIWLAPNKVGMRTNALLGSLGNGMKAPQVQVALKGLVDGGIEKVGHELGTKALLIVDSKRLGIQPRYNGRLASSFGLF